MAEYYLWFKALHTISFVSWMVGLLYLPRLYVYHVSAKKGGELDKTLCVMERRLQRIIMLPAMVATLVFGLGLIHIVGFKGLGGWFHIKALLLLFLFGFHGYMARCRRYFEQGNNPHSAKFYRLINEVPTVIMVVILILAIVKPF